MNNIAPLPPKRTADRMYCSECDSTEFHLLHTWEVRCAKCSVINSVFKWRFDVEVDECGEIHDN